MWSSVTPQPPDAAAPSARAKHSATLLGGHLYLLGGRNGNIPLKDFWRYSLAEGCWEQLSATGESPPCLQEHTAVAYKDSLYVFGGEVGFSAGTETPLWVYHVKSNSWRKVRAQKGVAVPRGRRGHSALVYQGAMLVYGGYQDLRGSSSDLWVFDFETESWHLLSARAGNGDQPPARHKHSAVLHDGAMWIYGGMTDLNDRADLWRWDTASKIWTCIRSKQGPGPLHSHAACKLPSSMLLFGGERDGHPSNELWRFHFGTETWERLQPSGPRPHARAESVALTVSELLLAPPVAYSGSPSSPSNLPYTPCSTSVTPAGLGPPQRSTRPRGGGSIDRANSCRPFHSKVSPCERKYVFRNNDITPSRGYTGGIEDSRQNIFVREFNKLSNINLAARLTRNNCSYSVLSNDSGDSCTSSNAPSEHETPSKMVKSASVNVISRNSMRRINNQNQQLSNVINNRSSTTTTTTQRPVSMGHNSLEPSCILPRDPVSVPNFSTIQTALTPIEATRLVFLQDSSEDDEDISKEEGNDKPSTCTVKPSLTTDFSTLHQIFQPPRAKITPTTERGEGEGQESSSCTMIEDTTKSSSSSRHSFHSNDSKTSSQDILLLPKSASVVRFKQHLVELEEVSDETVSTSDYASIETVNCIANLRISPDSRQCFNEEEEQEENKNKWENNSKFPPARPHLYLNKKQKNQKQDGPYSFSNPNYLGPDIHTILAGIQNGERHQQVKSQHHTSYAKLLNSPPDSVLEDATGRFLSQDELELHAMTPDTPSGAVIPSFPSGRRRANVPRSLALASPCGEYSQNSALRNTSIKSKTPRASSASRVEALQTKRQYSQQLDKYNIYQREFSFNDSELDIPIYMFLIGGKEHGQITVFKRPISIWKLELNPDIF